MSDQPNNFPDPDDTTELTLRSGNDLFSVGHLAGETGYSVQALLVAAVKLQLRPLCLDRVPFFTADEAERLLKFVGDARTQQQQAERERQEQEGRL